MWTWDDSSEDACPQQEARTQLVIGPDSRGYPQVVSAITGGYQVLPCLELSHLVWGVAVATWLGHSYSYIGPIWALYIWTVPVSLLGFRWSRGQSPTPAFHWREVIEKWKDRWGITEQAKENRKRQDSPGHCISWYDGCPYFRLSEF